MRWTVAVVVVAVGVVAVAPAVADDAELDVGVGALVGEAADGRAVGPFVSADLAFRVHPRVAVGLRVAYTRFTDDAIDPVTDRYIAAMPAVRLRWSDAWAQAAIGVLDHSRASESGFFGDNGQAACGELVVGYFLGPRRWSTRPALAAGALILPRLTPWVAVVVRL